MTSNTVKPVKYFAAILYRDKAALETALDQLTIEWSGVDYRSSAFAFNQTDYYQSEMGTDLQRIIISFSGLALPDCLVTFKKLTDNIEQALSINFHRSVNIDPGYLDLFKVVLASHKARGNKLYLSDGVWADPTLYYEKGEFQTFPWTFPDFKDRRYDTVLLKIRKLYKEALRSVSF